MTHFTVVVFGENVEDQMSKYDENIKVEPYIEEIKDVYIESCKKYLKTKGIDNPTKEDILKSDYFSDPKFIDGKFYETLTCNPNSKWDWYSIGGRWTGYFPLKKGRKGELGRSGLFTEVPGSDYADIVKLVDIDFTRARNEAREEAVKNFYEWEKIFTKFGKPKGWDQIDEKDIEKKRKIFRAQPAIKEYYKIDYYDPVEVYGFDKDAYVDKQVKRTLVPAAYVIDGEWHEKGTVGWFGTVSNEKPYMDWLTEYDDLIKTLDPETTLTLLDCHI